MRIPAYLLKDKVTITPFEGSGAYGPVYGTPYEAKARMEGKRQLVRDDQGNEVVAEIRGFFLPEITLKAQDKVNWNNKNHVVIGAVPQSGFRPSHIEAVLR